MEPFFSKSETMEGGCLRMEEDYFKSELDRHVGQALEKLVSCLNRVSHISWPTGDMSRDRSVIPNLESWRV